MDEYGVAAAILTTAKRVIALTGAGISVDSGIPDFRSPGGLWDKIDPMEYLTIEAFRHDATKSWEVLRLFDEMIEDAEPNPGHIALAELEKLGVLRAIVTQNIDNLHQLAGSKKVIEFHGNAATLTCLTCGARYKAAQVRGDGDVPECTSCGSILKPDVVFFGEAIPMDALDTAFREAERADVVIVAGTSAVVAPASQIPIAAKQNGAAIIEMNLTRTVLSSYSDVHIPGTLSETLPMLVESVRASLPG